MKVIGSTEYIGKAVKRRKRRASRRTEEDRFQKWCAAQLEAAGMHYTHPKNEGKKSPAVAAEDKRRGLVAGAPDFFVFLDGGRVLHVELKTPTGVLSAAQRRWRDKCRALKHEYRVIRGKREFLELISGGVSNV